MSRRFTTMTGPSLGLIMTLCALLPGLLPQAASARVANPDQEFLDREIAASEALAAEAPATVTASQPGLDLVRRILDHRYAAIGELGTSLALSGFDGIETSDRFDRAVVYALDTVAQAGVDADPTPATESQVQQFDTVMGTPPDLGQKPIAFMVLEMAKILVTTADLMGDDTVAPAPAPAKVALRRILDATTLYRSVQEDLIGASKAESMRQSSVVLRMRCLKDGGTYQVNNMKNKVGGAGEISTIYFLECTVCHLPEAVEFPLDLATRLNQASERQRLKNPPQPTQPNRGLKP